MEAAGTPLVGEHWKLTHYMLGSKKFFQKTTQTLPPWENPQMRNAVPQRNEWPRHGAKGKLMLAHFTRSRGA
jgi:hypothetical protein